MKYRVGRKQKRAVLDESGHEVVVFPKGKEKQAQEYCDYLNKTESDYDKWVDDMNDGKQNFA